MSRPTSAVTGFTLIELSIVLVILGLLAGGVLAGRDLIHAAQVRSGLSTVQQLSTAVSTFEAKYDCLPGDCAAASQFFPDCAADESIVGTWLNRCDGDGNGHIGEKSGTSGYVTEGTVRLWEHLGRAGLWPSTFAGTLGAAYEPGVNLPRLAAFESNRGPLGLNWIEPGSAGVRAAVVYQTDCVVDFDYSCEASQPDLAINTASGRHRLLLNGILPVTRTRASFLTGLRAEYVRDLDVKADDGRPLDGRVRAVVHAGYPGWCTDGNAANTQQGYQLAYLSDCAALIELDF